MASFFMFFLLSTWLVTEKPYHSLGFSTMLKQPIYCIVTVIIKFYLHLLNSVKRVKEVLVNLFAKQDIDRKQGYV